MAKEYSKDIDMEAYENGDLGTIRYLEKMYEAGREFRKRQVSRWRRNEELYNGDLLKPFNLPKYKTRIEPNIVHSVLETMYSIITDRPPKVDVMPKEDGQMQAAYQAQESIEWVLQDKKVQRAVSGMKRDGLLYGNGFLKIAVIDDEIEFINADPFTVFIDPLATSIQDMECIIFATPTYVDTIKDKYKKDVKPEGRIDEFRSFIKQNKEYATDKTPELQSSRDSGGDSKSTDYKGGQCILKEAWYYKNGELHLATWSGKTLLQDEKAPYDFIPVVMFKNYPSSHSVWGKGEPEIIESLAVGSSIALSQGMDNLILQGSPVVIMSKSLAKIPGNRMTDKPGHVVYVNGPHERIDRLPAGNISASTLPLAESMIGLADNVSGVHEVTKGMTPGSVTASRAIQQLNEASQTIIRAKEREIGIDAIIDIYKITLQLLSKNYSKTINIRKPSTDGSGFMFEKVEPYNLNPDMDFSYVPGSSMPESRAARRDEAMSLLQLGVLDEESFWRWTQMDITKERLDAIAQSRAEREQAISQEMEVMQNSTNEDEILEALLRQREMTGQAEQTRTAMVEGDRAKNQ